MQENIAIKPIKDSLEVEKRLLQIKDIVESPYHLRLEWLTEHNWIAIPVEGAGHFSEQDAKLLSKAMVAVGCQEVFAVATEPLENFPLCYRVTTSPKGLLDFSWECGFFNFILVPENLSFAVLCTARDYYIVAGPFDFVILAINSSIEVAREKFLRFADNPWWPDKDYRHFISVARRYQTLDNYSSCKLNHNKEKINYL